MKTFKGSGVALVTPFQTDGSIDIAALKALVTLQIQGGTDFLVVQGTTGESPTLSQDEKRLVLDTVLEVNNGQLPVVYGTKWCRWHFVGFSVLQQTHSKRNSSTFQDGGVFH
jgi:4-hydroxy-tetrahydrodipicolinate synthase